MNTEQGKNEALIRWLEGDLSGQELSEFEASEEFQDYKKIIDVSDDILAPKMDENIVFASIQNNISKNKTSPRSTKVVFFNKWVLAIASVAILTFGVMSIFANSINVSANVGQFVSHTLPDGSEVNLNGKSQINYNRNFKKERTLLLEGEAFFNVKEGKSFSIETSDGKVTVLGTSFNVFSRSDIFTVACKTGKVKVESNNQLVILQPGERIRFENKVSSGKEHIEVEKIGSWVNGEFYFINSKLEEVVLSLSSNYNTKINLPKDYQNKRFTGSFVSGDLNKALKMVFSPMGISYSMNAKGEVLITSE